MQIIALRDMLMLELQYLCRVKPSREYSKQELNSTIVCSTYTRKIKSVVLVLEDVLGAMESGIMQSSATSFTGQIPSTDGGETEGHGESRRSGPVFGSGARAGTGDVEEAT